MKNLNYIIIFALILFSCDRIEENNVHNELVSQDFEHFMNKNELEVINLKSFKNFSELREKMEKITCKGKVSGLKFELDGKIYNIAGFSDCPSSNETSCYFRKTFLTIRNDSLVDRYGKERTSKSIEYLKTELENILAKPYYNFKYNEGKIKPALIFLYIEDKYPISTTKKVLKEIAEQFDKINSVNNPEFFEYNILFQSFDISSIPPPPPPPVPNKYKIEE